MFERVVDAAREAELDAAFPDGWFALALSEELKPAGVLARRAFGRDLVLWRTADGDAHCADAECPHFAVNMGRGGKVVDDGLVCPIHGLRFDRAGQCMARHAGKPAPNYSIRTYPTAETGGLLHVWRDLARREPTPAPHVSGGALRRWTIEGDAKEAAGVCRGVAVDMASDLQFFITPVETAVTNITIAVSGADGPDTAARVMQRLDEQLQAIQPL